MYVPGYSFNGVSMDIIRVFAHNVRSYRQKLGLTQEELAERCGLHRTYINSLEREKRSISLKNIQLISEALEIEPYRLFIEYDQDDSSTHRFTGN